MKQLHLGTLVPLALLAGCAMTHPEPQERVVYVERAPPPFVETSAVPGPPRNDIPESQRQQWFAAQQPQVRYVPPQVVERVVVRDRPVYYRDDWYDAGWRDPWYDRWYAPFSVSLGWWGGHWGGHHGRGRGWGWGVGWNNGWRW